MIWSPSFSQLHLGLQVNEKTIGFLSALRAKMPELADQRFVILLARAELDPFSDANTVSGLSSYAFTPGLYVTFSANGSVNWSPAEQPIAAPKLLVNVRSKLFQVAASILLRPLTPPDQDFTSAGRTGKYMVIKRLLPLFDQYAPNTALAKAAGPHSAGDQTAIICACCQQSHARQLLVTQRNQRIHF